MKKLTRKSISVLLSLLMALSVFGGLAFTASAADWTTSNSLPASVWQTIRADKQRGAVASCEEQKKN